MGAICLDCLEEFYTDADELIGYPTLDTAPISSSINDSDWLRNFGYLYESLAAFQMKTVNLMSYKAFLEKHRGHRIYSIDYDGEPDEIIAELDKARDQDLVTTFKFDTSEFLELFYEIECKTCNVTTRLDHEKPIKILPFDTTKLQVKEQEKFFERILDYESANDNYIYSFELLWSEDYFDNAYQFIKTHLGHELYAKCSCDANSNKFVTAQEMLTVISEQENALKIRVDNLIYAKAVDLITNLDKHNDLELSETGIWLCAKSLVSDMCKELQSTFSDINEITDEYIMEVFKVVSQELPEYLNSINEN